MRIVFEVSQFYFSLFLMIGILSFVWYDVLYRITLIMDYCEDSYRQLNTNPVNTIHDKNHDSKPLVFPGI